MATLVFSKAKRLFIDLTVYVHSRGLKVARETFPLGNTILTCQYQRSMKEPAGVSKLDGLGVRHVTQRTNRAGLVGHVQTVLLVKISTPRILEVLAMSTFDTAF